MIKTARRSQCCILTKCNEPRLNETVAYCFPKFQNSARLQRSAARSARQRLEARLGRALRQPKRRRRNRAEMNELDEE
jgi:hypothetical protein